MSIEHFDILIIGAGISGIGVACHLRRELPNKRFAILERRSKLGGTWDLFRFPGIRSDSDMFSFGYDFRPWRSERVLGDGDTIRRYMADTARAFGVDQSIRFGLKILRADWSSEQRRWTLQALHEATGETRHYSCDFLLGCTGYFNHDAGFRPSFAGEENFRGTTVHPQHWPEGLDYAGKKVVVIGSGATAVTLVPAMAGAAAHVTMLQRSPSYIFSVPSFDQISMLLKRFMPEHSVYALARKRSIRVQGWLYSACRRWPNAMRKLLLGQVRKQLGSDADMRHFTPRYMPWDERLCIVPNGDLFKALRSGKASVVTDEIDSFTEGGIRLKSGEELSADVVVTATGLQLQLLGGVELYVDGQPRALQGAMTYKGILAQDVPNLATVFGYTNASWTLKVDLVGRYVCRLLRYMDSKGFAVVTPHDREGCAMPSGVMESLQSGYVKRSTHLLPRQGSKSPWKVSMNYQSDREMLLRQPIEDASLQFEAARSDVPPHAQLATA